MRTPAGIECLYLDFDGFFASVMQQALPHLRGKPVGVIPMPTNRPESTSVIAVSKEAKAFGVKNVMRVSEARALCPGLILEPQRPDYFRRAHNALLNEIACVLPIETVKSIDELTCRLDTAAAADPHGVAATLKRRLADHIGPYITCSIGFAANRLLAKMACKINKPDGVTVWAPEDMPGPLLGLPLDAVPGVGARMEARLRAAGVHDMAALLATQPKQLRALWRNVTGERLWYALHGRQIAASPTRRSMFGHSRVLPPEARHLGAVRECARLLLVKAARRMRRDGHRAQTLSLSLRLLRPDRRWSAAAALPTVHDDHACLAGLAALWDQVCADLPPSATVLQCGVALFDLTPMTSRQLDMFRPDDAQRQRWEAITSAIDVLNTRHGRRVVTIGAWNPPGAFAGGKISYTRIPDAEDFL